MVALVDEKAVAPQVRLCDPAQMPKKDGLSALMHLVCEEWCLGSAMDERGNSADFRRFIPATGDVRVEQFIEAIFRASPAGARTEEPKWQRARVEIRSAFVRLLGHETVDAERLQWETQLPLPNPEAFARKLTSEELDREVASSEDRRDAIVARQELSRRARPARLALLVLLSAFLFGLAFCDTR